MNPTDFPRLILGSSSRYRRELLQRLGLPFEVVAPDVDESPQPQERPNELALRLALTKAQAVAATCGDDVIVIGSEAHGVSREAQELQGNVVHTRIPMVRQLESFNAAVAGSVLLAEATRQRQRQQ